MNAFCVRETLKKKEIKFGSMRKGGREEGGEEEEERTVERMKRKRQEELPANDKWQSSSVCRPALLAPQAADGRTRFKS
jgi:hypothetical protein